MATEDLGATEGQLGLAGGSRRPGVLVLFDGHDGFVPCIVIRDAEVRLQLVGVELEYCVELLAMSKVLLFILLVCGIACSDRAVTPRPVTNAISAPYSRDLYEHWIDADRDCQNTRQEVLIAESLIPVMLDAQGCRVASGLWFDSFTGQEFTDPSGLHIDHMVPLAEAHRSGSDT